MFLKYINERTAPIIERILNNTLTGIPVSLSRSGNIEAMMTIAKTIGEIIQLTIAKLRRIPVYRILILIPKAR